MIEIGRPFLSPLVHGVELRIFQPANGAAQSVWVCLEDVFAACGLEPLSLKVAVARVRDNFPELCRVVQVGRERCHLAGFKTVHEILGLLEADGFTSPKDADAVSAAIVEAANLQIVYRFPGLPMPLYQHQEAVEWHAEREAHSAAAPSLFGHEAPAPSTVVGAAGRVVAIQSRRI